MGALSPRPINSDSKETSNTAFNMSSYAPVAPGEGSAPLSNDLYDPYKRIRRNAMAVCLGVIALASANYLVKDVVSSGVSGTSMTGSLRSNTNVVKPHVGRKKVLVTGAAGFVASHVAEKLLARGDDVVVVDEVNDYYDTRVKENNLALLRKLEPDEKRLSIYRGDIADADFITDVFEKEKPSWVCHLAARAGVRYSIIDPYIYVHSNVKGTVQLMELSVKHNITNFVYASSSSVYGGSKSTFFSEAENVDHPISPYAASKKSVELMAYTYHHLYGLKTSGLRFFTVYGPRGRPDMAPFIFIDRISRGKPIKQFGDGTTSRDYTYIDDIADGVIRAVDRPYDYEVFNLGKGDGTSLKDFINLVQKYTKKNATINVLPEQPGDVPYTCADVNHAKRLLGYKSSVPFEEGIKRTVKWYNSPDAVIARDEEDIEKEKEKAKAKAKKAKKGAGEDEKDRRKLSIKEVEDNDRYYPTDGSYYPLY
mmetsp:Transcript_18844/g.40774  ORF Transcript_18844/g.40774 Transcript_18844/m.40774 type:complete len:480 (-) Transcript_18844:146-1585(-)